MSIYEFLKVFPGNTRVNLTLVRGNVNKVVAEGRASEVLDQVSIYTLNEQVTEAYTRMKKTSQGYITSIDVYSGE